MNIRNLMKTNEAVATEMRELTQIANISNKYQQQSRRLSDATGIQRSKTIVGSKDSGL
jgi:hypothetical protein